jgi:hypothetical protein
MCGLRSRPSARWRPFYETILVRPWKAAALLARGWPVTRSAEPARRSMAEQNVGRDGLSPSSIQAGIRDAAIRRRGIGLRRRLAQV